MIRVVIVDDQKVITQGLKVLLESEQDIEIVGLGANGHEAINLVSSLQPDVLLIDHYMPVMDGIVATRSICKDFPKVAVLLLSGSDNDDCITEAIQAGAKGYLLKNTSSEDLANSIRSVHRGYSQMGPGLLEKLFAKVGTVSQSSPASPTDKAVSVPQTALESQLLQLLNIPSQFDQDGIKRLLQAVDTSQSATDLIWRLEQQLQSNPKHITALYLFGKLTWQFQQQPQQAINVFRRAFECAKIQNFPLSIHLYICQEVWSINSGEAFNWLKTLLRQWPSDQPIRPFFDSLARTFGVTSTPYRLLKATWEIQSLKGLCEEANALESKLSPFNPALKAIV